MSISQKSCIWTLREELLTNHQKASQAGLALALKWPENRMWCHCQTCYEQGGPWQPEVEIKNNTVVGKIIGIPVDESWKPRMERRMCVIYRSLEFFVDLSNQEKIKYTRIEKDDGKSWGSKQVFVLAPNTSTEEIFYENKTKPKEGNPPAKLTPETAETSLIEVLTSLNEQINIAMKKAKETLNQI